MKKNHFELFTSAIKSPQTKMNYIYSLNEFMKFSKIKSYQDISKPSTEKIDDLLENWVLTLRKKGLKGPTIRTKLSGVELFLDMNKIDFHRKVLRKMIPTDDYVPGGDTPYTTEEIQKMLSSTTKLRTKALIHFLSSMGPRTACLIDPILKLKHLREMPHGCMAIKIYDGSKQSYWGFLTPEATTALKSYLNSRKLNGETLNNDSPIFSNFKNASWRKKNTHLSEKSLRQLISRVVRVAGIENNKDGNRFDKAPIYGFRKRFATILKQNKDVNQVVTEILLGHKPGLDKNYYRPTLDECFSEFVKTVPELTIDKTERQKAIISKQNEEISELQRNKERIEKLENEHQELCDIIYRKEVIKLIDNPNFLKKIKFVGLDGKKITDDKEWQVIYKDYAAQADRMRKEVNQLSQKYVDKILH